MTPAAASDAPASSRKTVRTAVNRAPSGAVLSGPVGSAIYDEAPDAASVATSVSGYFVSAAPLALSTDTTFADLANSAVESMTKLIEGAT